MKRRRWELWLWTLVVAGSLSPAALAQAPRPGKGTVYVGDSPAAQDLIEQARALRQQGRLLEAANLYQQIVEQYPDKLMAGEGSAVYTDAARRVMHDLTADAPLLESYRRAFEPAAQRALASAVTPEALELLAARYRVCRAGLEAALRVAGMFLERGLPVDAATALEGWDDHPDMPALASRYHTLAAQAAILSGRPERAAGNIAALTAANDRPALAMLEGLAAGLRLPPAPPNYDSMAQLPRAATLDKPAKALWQVSVPDPLGDESTKNRMRGMPQFGDPAQGGNGNMFPQADEQRIYVNNYLTVMALDRLSGRVAWMFQPPEILGGQLTVAPWLRMQGKLPDQRGFAIDGGNVITVVGLAMAGNPQFQPAGAVTALICLDRETGKQRWRIEPREIDPSLLGASFHGTPAVAGGRVFAMLRRSHFSGFQDAFVVAVDTQTGKLAWRRYLSSSASMPRAVGRGMAQMVVERGRLYVANSLGVAACLDVRNGMVWWLNVLPGAGEVVDMNNIGARMGGRPGQIGNAWQASPPVLVDAGLIVPGEKGGETALLIDPRTGALLRELTGPVWAESDYFTRAGDDVLCVGPTVHRLDGKTLEPRWSQKLAKEGAVRPQGRAAVTLDRVIIPVSNDRLMALNLADGTEVSNDPLAPAGNLLVLDDQLVVADATTVRDYMDWGRAYRRLKERIARSPDDPRSALALGYLALTANEHDAVLEGVDEALAALRRGGATLSPARQRDAFSQLLSMAESTAAPAETRRAIFERLASAASGAADQVAFHLGAGAFAAETGDAADAADHYQAVLADVLLAAELYQRGAISRQAGLEARSRLEALLKRFGPSTYERFDALASQRLAELTRQGADPALLLELARQYPLAKVVPAAVTQAATALEGLGDLKAAAVQYRRAYGMTTDAGELAEIAGRMGQLLTHSGQPRQAMRWLERIRREHPGLEPKRDGQVVTVESWLAELAKIPVGDQAMPALAMPLGQPQVFAGRLLTPTEQPQEQWPRDRMLLVEGGQKLVMRAGPKLDVAWATTPFEGERAAALGSMELLAFYREQAVFWSQTERTLLAVDTVTGQPAWPQVDVRQLLNQAGGEAERRAARTMEERNFERFANPNNLVMRNGKLRNVDQLRNEVVNTVSVGVNEFVIVFADRTGRVVALDRKTGRRLWQTICPLDELSDISLSGDTLLVVGSNGAFTDVVSGHLLLLDPATGEPRLPMLEEKSPILWSALGAEGGLVYATASELIGRQTGDGRVAWRMPVSPTNGQPPSFRLCDDLLFMLDALGGLAVIDPTNGQALNRLAIAPGSAQLDVRAFEQQWQVLTPAQEIALGPDAKIRWRDAINPFGKQLALQLLGERTLVLLNLTSGPRGLAAAGLWPNNGDMGRQAEWRDNNNGAVVILNQNQVQARAVRGAIRVEGGPAAAQAQVFQLEVNEGPAPKVVVPPPPPVPAPAPAQGLVATRPKSPAMTPEQAAAEATKAAKALQNEVNAKAADPAAAAPRNDLLAQAGVVPAKPAPGPAGQPGPAPATQKRDAAPAAAPAVAPAPVPAAAAVSEEAFRTIMRFRAERDARLKQAEAQKGQAMTAEERAAWLAEDRARERKMFAEFVDRSRAEAEARAAKRAAIPAGVPPAPNAPQAAAAAEMQQIGQALRMAMGNQPAPPVPPPGPGIPPGPAIPPDPAANPVPAQWVYKLYVLDRYSGALIEDRDLTPLPEAIDVTRALFLDNRIVLTAGDATVVIPGAPPGK